MDESVAKIDGSVAPKFSTLRAFLAFETQQTASSISMHSDCVQTKQKYVNKNEEKHN